MFISITDKGFSEDEALTSDAESDGLWLTRFLVSVYTVIYSSVRLLDLEDAQGQISIFILARRNKSATFQSWPVAHLPLVKLHDKFAIFFPLDADVVVGDTLVRGSIAGDSRICSDANAFQMGDLDEDKIEIFNKYSRSKILICIEGKNH